MNSFTGPYEIVFVEGQFKIVVEAIMNPGTDLPGHAEYELRYIAHDHGISADVKSEAWNIDFRELSKTFETILKEFLPGASRKVDFSHGVFSITMTTESRGPLNLHISLRPDPWLATVFTFETAIQQEDAKRLIREMNTLL